VLASARRLSGGSYGPAFEILEKAGVGVRPGIDLGKNGEGYPRFCCAKSPENITARPGPQPNGPQDGEGRPR